MCMPTSLAMLANTTVESILKLIGHDGSEILDDSQPEPTGRRAFHMDELTHAAYQLGIGLIRFDGTLMHQHRPPVNTQYAHAYLSYGPGLIATMGQRNGHMAAWDGSRIYDPTTPKTIDKVPDRLIAFWLAVNF